MIAFSSSLAGDHELASSGALSSSPQASHPLTDAVDAGRLPDGSVGSPTERRSGSDRRNTICSGWLIARVARSDSQYRDSQYRAAERFLQLGTGQWCGLSAATWFPVRSAAAAYAADLAFDREYQIVIVYRKRPAHAEHESEKTQGE